MLPVVIRRSFATKPSSTQEYECPPDPESFFRSSKSATFDKSGHALCQIPPEVRRAIRQWRVAANHPCGRCTCPLQSRQESFAAERKQSRLPREGREIASSNAGLARRTRTSRAFAALIFAAGRKYSAAARSAHHTWSSTSQSLAAASRRSRSRGRTRLWGGRSPTAPPASQCDE